MAKIEYLYHHEGCCGGCSSTSGSGCGGCSGANLPPSDKNPLEVHISPDEEQFLKKLAQTPFLPIVQYVMTSSKSEHLTNMALSPVFLETGAESLDEIKALGDVILDLEERSIISLDFDTPLEGTDESIYYNSASFQLLKDAIEDGKKQAEFLFDAPSIVFGSVCFTALGDLIIDQLEFL